MKGYWIVYPEEKQIELYTLKNKVFELSDTFAESDKLTSEVVDGFSIQLKEIFDR